MTVERRRQRCYLPGFLRRGRAWGVACQLYGLTSRRNWGIGDFEDLRQLATAVAAAGADFVGLNPLNALFPSDPERASPYQPSSRRFLNPLYIAPDTEPEFSLIARPDDGDLDALREQELVDYAGVAALKLPVLAEMFRAFRAAGEPARREAFSAFRAAEGEALDAFCAFEAIAEAMGGTTPWQRWPAGFRQREAETLERFRADHEERVAFSAWLQWLADGQLARAQETALAAGMRIGLYVDLAVGVAPDGAAAWADPELVVSDASIGAPPDTFNAYGQDWGLAPFSPLALAARGLEPFRADLAAAMRHAGAVRLDHAMVLRRLYWVPHGKAPPEGHYVDYPLEDMLAATAAQSRAARCLVIGEALGTVPTGFTTVLAGAGIQSYRLLIFERLRDGSFRRPGRYPASALTCLSTHDLPTLKGWWIARDVDWREDIGYFDAPGAARERASRKGDRERLWRALATEHLVPAGGRVPEALPDAAVVAAHRFIARTPSRLVGVQLEDALGLVEQANLPGRSEPHPNWRRKLPVPVEALAGDGLAAAVFAAMADERPR